MAVPKLFRKKPVVIEAVQFGTSVSGAFAAANWVMESVGFFSSTPVLEGRTQCPASGASFDQHTGDLLIATPEGLMRATPGDWIIRGIQGEFYPCKPDIFEQTYEPAEDTP